MKKLEIRLKLQWKIVFLIVVVVFSFGLVTVILVGDRVSKSLYGAKKETINLVSVEQTLKIQQALQFARDAADVAPSIPGIVEYMENKNKVIQDKSILNSLIDFGTGRKFLNVFLLDTTGTAVVSTDTKLLQNNFGFRKYFQKALEGENFSEMVIGTVSKQPGFYFSTPVKNKKEKIVGVAVVKMDPQPVYETLISSYIYRLGKFMLVNDDGVVIFTNKEAALYKSLGVMNERIKKQIEEEKRYLGKEIVPLDYDVAQERVENGLSETYSYEFFDEEDNENELIEVNKVGDFPLYFVSEVNSSTVKTVVNDLERTIVFFIFTIIIIGVIIQTFILRRMLRPLSSLDEYAKAVSSGNYTQSLVVKTRDELESLADSVKEMVSSLKGFYSGLEEKVKEKTAEVEKTLEKVEKKNIDLENTKKAVLNVMEDLNEEKERLFFEKNRIETILKSIGDGVFVTDDMGRISIVNRAAEVMSGYTSMEAKNKKYTDVFKFMIEDHPETPYPDFVNNVLTTGKQVSLEKHSVIVRKDGVEIPVLDSAAPVKDINGKTFGCVVVFRDNTRERELEKSKDDFLSVTSHQLRTPLGSMRWNVEMLLAGDAGKLPDEAKMIAGQIHDGNLRMIGLVNDLLNVNRIDQGRVLDEPTKTDLSQVIKEASSELDFEAKARRVAIKMSLQKVDMMEIDPKRFREVIMNLVSNAVKYNKVGGKVEVVMKSSGKWIVISIHDNGVGIPKRDIPNMFKKFFRASNAVHSETEGSGLGLYVVKKFVEGWGGKIELESKEGKGSVFTVYLPKIIKKLHTDE